MKRLLMTAAIITAVTAGSADAQNVPLEPDGFGITDSLLKKLKSREVDPQQFVDELVVMIRAQGYSCNSISSLIPLSVSVGWKVYCNRFAYTYEIADEDGKFVVTLN